MTTFSFRNLKILLASIISLTLANPATATENILYLNSTRGDGTLNYGNFRHLIANTLDNYKDGNIFDVDYIQTHVPGNLAFWLNSKPLEYYHQIWFDTTIYKTFVLNTADLSALNTWAGYQQPEFILDSSFFARSDNTNSITNAAASVTINQALALKEKGRGIFIGTDHNSFAYTANQILANFGFDGSFTNSYNITSNGSFVGDLLLSPEPVSNDFFTKNLQGLSTSNVPIGKHILNENGGNRTIEIYENLYSYSPGKISHVGSSFSTGTNISDINNPNQPDPKDIPEPGSSFGLLAFGIFGFRSILKRKQ